MSERYDQKFQLNIDMYNILHTDCFNDNTVNGGNALRVCLEEKPMECLETCFTNVPALQAKTTAFLQAAATSPVRVRSLMKKHGLLYKKEESVKSSALGRIGGLKAAAGVAGFGDDAVVEYDGDDLLQIIRLEYGEAVAESDAARVMVDAERVRKLRLDVFKRRLFGREVVSAEEKKACGERRKKAADASASSGVESEGSLLKAAGQGLRMLAARHKQDGTTLWSAAGEWLMDATNGLGRFHGERGSSSSGAKKKSTALSSTQKRALRSRVSEERNLQQCEDTEGSEENCRQIKNACDCAAARAENGCAWRSWDAKDRDAGSCRKPRAGQSLATSCYECIGQTGCKPIELWERLGSALPAIKPHVKVYGSEAELRTEAKDMKYPKAATVERVATTRDYDATNQQITSSSLASDVTLTQQLCGAVTFLQHDDSLMEEQVGYVSDFEEGAIENAQVAFSVRVNESNADGQSVGIQMSGPKITPRPNLLHSIAYSSSGFLGVQSVVNDFLRCGSGGQDSDKCYGKTGLKVSADDEFAMAPTDIAVGSFGTPKYTELLCVHRRVCIAL